MNDEIGISFERSLFSQIAVGGFDAVFHQFFIANFKITDEAEDARKGMYVFAQGNFFFVYDLVQPLYRHAEIAGAKIKTGYFVIEDENGVSVKSRNEVVQFVL